MERGRQPREDEQQLIVVTLHSLPERRRGISREGVRGEVGRQEDRIDKRRGEWRGEKSRGGGSGKREQRGLGGVSA